MSKIETIFGTGLVSLTCPHCGTRMRIHLIMQDGPGRDRRTYICDACKRTETIAVKYR
jgi:transposase-like protein